MYLLILIYNVFFFISKNLYYYCYINMILDGLMKGSIINKYGINFLYFVLIIIVFRKFIKL